MYLIGVFSGVVVVSVELCKDLLLLLSSIAYWACPQRVFSRVLTEWFCFRTVYFAGFGNIFLNDFDINLLNIF